MALTSAKDILKTTNVLEPTDEEGNKVRGTAHEFQDYAYRLAKDLNDLEHITIYMSLVKRVERHILERAFQYVADSDIDNRGKLFMWKLKQIREAIDKEQNATNFEYEFVKKRIKEFRDVMAVSGKSLKSKSVGATSTSRLQRSEKKTKRKLKRALILGCTNRDLPVELVKNEYRVMGVDISPKVVGKIKNEFDGSAAAKFICKDLFDKKFGKTKFDLIYIGNYWQNIPLQTEEELIELIKELSADNSIIIIEIKRASKNDQEWQELQRNNQEIFYLSKTNTFSTVNQKFERKGFSLTEKFDLNRGRFEMVYQLGRG